MTEQNLTPQKPSENSSFQEIKQHFVDKNEQEYNLWMSEISPYLDYLKPHLKSYLDAKYNGNIETKPQFFETDEKIITQVIDNFAEETITNEDLRKTYLNNFHSKNPNVITVLQVNLPSENIDENQWKNTSVGNIGRIFPEDIDNNLLKNEDIGKVLIKIRLGTEQPNGKIKACIGDISAYVHEVAHSTSERYTSKEPMGMKSGNMPEVEAICMENLFQNYLEKNATELSSQFYKDGLIPSENPNHIINMIKSYRAYRDKGLDEMIEKIQTEAYNSKKPFAKQKMFRYVVAEIYGYLLEDEYNKNPEKTIDQYAEFLKNNSTLSIDDCSKVLFGNDNMTKEKVLNKFVTTLDNRTQKLLQMQEEQSM